MNFALSLCYPDLLQVAPSMICWFYDDQSIYLFSSLLFLEKSNGSNETSECTFITNWNKAKSVCICLLCQKKDRNIPDLIFININLHKQTKLLLEILFLLWKVFYLFYLSFLFLSLAEFQGDSPNIEAEEKKAKKKIDSINKKRVELTREYKDLVQVIPPFIL